MGITTPTSQYIKQKGGEIYGPPIAGSRKVGHAQMVEILIPETKDSFLLKIRIIY